MCIYIWLSGSNVHYSSCQHLPSLLCLGLTLYVYLIWCIWIHWVYWFGIYQVGLQGSRWWWHLILKKGMVAEQEDLALALQEEHIMVFCPAQAMDLPWHVFKLLRDPRTLQKVYLWCTCNVSGMQLSMPHAVLNGYFASVSLLGDEKWSSTTNPIYLNPPSTPPHSANQGDNDCVTFTKWVFA